MELEKRTYDEIALTLIKCQGIRIIMIFERFREGRIVFDMVENGLQRIDFYASISLKKRSNHWELVLQNDSLVTLLPKNPQYMCGMRAHQVIVGRDLAKDDTFINEVARPLIVANHKLELFPRGIFEYE